MATAESVEALLRTFLKVQGASGASSAEAQKQSAAEEILFDVEVEGARYLLIKLPKVSQVGPQLSPREREIVRLVALGHSNKIIADVLSISSWTVSTHLRRIFVKMGVGSRAAMVAHVSIPAIHEKEPPSSVVVPSGELARERFG